MTEVDENDISGFMNLIECIPEEYKLMTVGELNSIVSKVYADINFDPNDDGDDEVELRRAGLV